MAERGRSILVGRDGELATLAGVLAGTAAGRGAIVVAEGEAGIGKTRLLQEAHALARASGFAVQAATGFELGHERPYGAIAEALELRSASDDRDRAAIAGLLRGVTGGEHLEFRLLEDMLALVERLSIERPVVVTVDDLQWVDSASLVSLAHIAHHLAPLRVALIGAVRTPPRRPQVDQFLRSVAGTARWLRLEALSEPAVEALVADLVGGTPSDELRHQVARAAGNPLFVSELAATLRPDGSLAQGAYGAEEGGEPLPPSIQRLVQHRLSLLPQVTARVLGMASLLGSDFSPADLADHLRRPVAAVVELLGPALDDGLLVGAGDRLSFRHQLVRDAIYVQMPLAMRSALHGEIGQLLAARGAEALQVATHLALGGEGGRTAAVEWLRRAANEAQSRSPTQAVELLDRALALGGPRHQARADMLVDRALTLTWAGRADESLRAARHMLSVSAGTGREDRLRLGLARALMVQGRWPESARELEVLAGRAESNELEHARLLGDAATALAHAGELERAVDLAARAREVGERLDDDLTRSIAASSLAVVAHFEARYRDSVEMARRAVELAERSGRQESGLRPTSLWLGLALADVDEFEEALAVLEAGRQRSEDAGTHWQLPLYDDGIATVHFYSGDWDDAVAEIETCIALAAETGTLWWMVPANCMLAYIAIQRDQDDLAESAISAASRHSQASGEFGANRLLWVKGLHQEALGRPLQALALLEEAWGTTAAAGFLPHQLIIGPDLVRVAMAVGDRERAGDVAGSVQRASERTGVPSAVATGDRCRGLVEADEGRLRAAVASLRASRRRVDLAFACEEAAACLARLGRVDAAVELLDEALAELRRCGAQRAARRVVSALQSLGVRRHRGGRAPRPLLGWDALTETELRVAELASRGLTNPAIGDRLYISRRTVATHLSHIFGKLEISSRVELARAAEERRQRE
jgi:DNA-binding NarL/FixJ family response regulator